MASAPCEAGRDKHPSPGGGPEAAHYATPRCQLRGLGMDIHAAHPPPPRLRDVTMEQLQAHCTPSECYCGVAASPNTSTTPKVASAVNIPSHAWSSHSGEGTARASLDEDDAWEDDFQNSALTSPPHNAPGG